VFNIHVWLVAMLAGVLSAIVAAVGLGAGDVSAGITARRFGTIQTAAASVCLSLIGFVLFAIIAHLEIVADPRWFVTVIGLGVLRAIGYLFLVEALRLGPLSVVSVMVGCSAAVKVTLAVVLLGEQPELLQWTAVPLATAGSVLAVYTTAGSPIVRPTVGTTGVVYAMIAVVSLGLVTVGLKVPLLQGGLVQTVIVRRAAELFVTVLVLVLARHRSAVGFNRTGGNVGLLATGSVELNTRNVRRALLSFAAVAGLDSLGLASLALALTIAPAWLVGLITSASPCVALLTGVVLYHERLRERQWIGIGLIAASVVLATIG
jgi:drug/metabolite transporter (DMT)-like permease